MQNFKIVTSKQKRKNQPLQTNMIINCACTPLRVIKAISSLENITLHNTQINQIQTQSIAPSSSLRYRGAHIHIYLHVCIYTFPPIRRRLKRIAGSSRKVKMKNVEREREPTAKYSEKSGMSIYRGGGSQQSLATLSFQSLMSRVL